MGEFKGFMKYDKQKLAEMPLRHAFNTMRHISHVSHKKMRNNKGHAAWIVGPHFAKWVKWWNVKQWAVRSVTTSQNGTI